jgi:anti-sigma regulatory factor (Ser/Thr protein kinase)
VLDEGSFPAHPAALAAVRTFVHDLAEDATLAPAMAEDLVLAVSEACAIFVRSGTSSSVRIRWTLGEGRVVVEVVDHGPLDTDGDPGRMALSLMRQGADDVEIFPGGGPSATGRIVLRKRLA